MTIPPPLNRSRGLSITQLVVSILALSICGIALLGLTGASLLAQQGTLADNEQTWLFPHLIWILVFLIVLATLSLVASIRGIAGKPTRSAGQHGFLLASLGLALFLLLFLVGKKAAEQEVTGWLLAPVNILIVLLPLWWTVELGRLQLKPESSQRRWGVVSLSTFITLPVIMLVEVLFLLVLLVFASIWLLGQPEVAPILQQFGSQFAFDPLTFQPPEFDFLPLLSDPGVIFAGFAIVSLVIPIIEESLKPLAVWSLFKHELTPSGGFIAGMLCGAAFAFVESAFSLSAAGGQEWGFTALGRAGTGLLHAFTAGLNGWALAAAWRDANYIRQGLTFALTVALHGIWNFFAVFLGISQIGTEWPLPTNPALSAAAPWVLSGLTLVILVSIFAMNRHLRREEKEILVPPILPPPLFNGEIR